MSGQGITISIALVVSIPEVLEVGGEAALCMGKYGQPVREPAWVTKCDVGSLKLIPS